MKDILKTLHRYVFIDIKYGSPNHWYLVDIYNQGNTVMRIWQILWIRNENNLPESSNIPTFPIYVWCEWSKCGECMLQLRSVHLSILDKKYFSIVAYGVVAFINSTKAFDEAYLFWHFVGPVIGWCFAPYVWLGNQYASICIRIRYSRHA